MAPKGKYASYRFHFLTYISPTCSYNARFTHATSCEIKDAGATIRSPPTIVDLIEYDLYYLNPQLKHMFFSEQGRMTQKFDQKHV